MSAPTLELTDALTRLGRACSDCQSALETAAALVERPARRERLAGHARQWREAKAEICAAAHTLGVDSNDQPSIAAVLRRA
jgi:hypothetical protein